MRLPAQLAWAHDVEVLGPGDAPRGHVAERRVTTPVIVVVLAAADDHTGFKHGGSRISVEALP